MGDVSQGGRAVSGLYMLWSPLLTVRPMTAPKGSQRDPAEWEAPLLTLSLL